MVDPENARPAPRRISRRPVLFGLVGAALAVPAAGLLAGCGSDKPDPLEALATRARRDVALIDKARTGSGVPPAKEQQLTELASARRAHAQALAVELGTAESEADARSGEGTTPTPPPDKADMASVLSALEKARAQASALVTSLPRQRASLVGSIAACCAAYHSVLA